MSELEFWLPKINASLDTLEKELGIRLLHVCESGSRAWGFPSADSDFDVRFLYAQPLAGYLRLGRLKDTREWFDANGMLDFSGWDVKKALELFMACNLSLNEHLRSPLVYREQPSFSESLRALIPDYFQPVKGMFRYFSSAQHNEELLKDSPLIILIVV
ncbi:MAG: nucleotidyltransferase domain-containing protein [Planctomycetia bacterium]|nr:nucleotidyltransferase domain-containing protein [Planctomycetia bacterium]